MYAIKFILKRRSITIPIDKYANSHNDLHLFSIIKPNLYKIYGFLFNNQYIYDGFTIQLLDDENVLCEKKIIPDLNLICHFNGFKPSSNLNIEEIIEELFDELEAYIIEITDGEISKVTLGNSIVNTEWFIDNIYRNTTERYYRKFNTFDKIKIFKRDIK